MAVALARTAADVAVADAGRSVGLWVERATSMPDALPDAVRQRVSAAATATDPDEVVHRSRFLI